MQCTAMKAIAIRVNMPNCTQRGEGKGEGKGDGRGAHCVLLQSASRHLRIGVCVGACVGVCISYTMKMRGYRIYTTEGEAREPVYSMTPNLNCITGLYQNAEALPLPIGSSRAVQCN